MNTFLRQFGVLFTTSLLLAGGMSVAAETAVEPSGKGVDLIQDPTAEDDARSPQPVLGRHSGSRRIR